MSEEAKPVGLKVGDVVELRSGGPGMTVSCINTHSRSYPEGALKMKTPDEGRFISKAERKNYAYEKGSSG